MINQTSFLSDLEYALDNFSLLLLLFETHIEWFERKL